MNAKFIAIFIFLLCTILYNKSEAQVSTIQAEKFFAIADKYFDKNDFQNAIVYYDSTIYVDAEHLEAYAYRGICRFELKQFDEAIIDFDFALMLTPGYAEVYYFRGLAKSELGYMEKACNDWFEAYNLGYKKAMKIIKQNCEKQLKERQKK